MKEHIEERNDYAIDAMVHEVERRKKEKPCGRYSYGKLVADTTLEERQGIAERYLGHPEKGRQNIERFKEPDDDRDIQKVTAQDER